MSVLFEDGASQCPFCGALGRFDYGWPDDARAFVCVECCGAGVLQRDAPDIGVEGAVVVPLAHIRRQEDGDAWRLNAGPIDRDPFAEPVALCTRTHARHLVWYGMNE